MAQRRLSGGVVGPVGWGLGGVKERKVRYEARKMQIARRMEGRSGDVNGDEDIVEIKLKKVLESTKTKRRFWRLDADVVSDPCYLVIEDKFL